MKLGERRTERDTMPRRTAKSIIAGGLMLGATVPLPARADFFDDVRRTFQHDIPRAFGAEPKPARTQPRPPPSRPVSPPPRQPRPPPPG